MTDENAPTDPAPPDETATIDARRPSLVPVDEHAKHLGITNLRHGGLPGTVSVLECTAGSSRARHYHREDSHWLYIVRGEVEYYERPIGSTETPGCQHFYEGEMFYTPKQVEHALYFPRDTILVSMSDRTRTHEEHEADVVRVEFKLPGE
jgi:quercetin dioxygenase-like cupin family protein